jgi:hypothetical protein
VASPVDGKSPAGEPNASFATPGFLPRARRPASSKAAQAWHPKKWPPVLAAVQRRETPAGWISGVVVKPAGSEYLPTGAVPKALRRQPRGPGGRRGAPAGGQFAEDPAGGKYLPPGASSMCTFRTIFRGPASATVPGAGGPSGLPVQLLAYPGRRVRRGAVKRVTSGAGAHKRGGLGTRTTPIEKFSEFPKRVG